MKDVFDRDEVQGVLKSDFYRAKPVSRPRKERKKAKARPDHYDVICISMYKEDLARLDAKVKELKRAGHRKMSRSALIRFALDTVDASKLPRSY